MINLDNRRKSQDMFNVFSLMNVIHFILETTSKIWWSQIHSESVGDPPSYPSPYH